MLRRLTNRKGRWGVRVKLGGGHRVDGWVKRKKKKTSYGVEKNEGRIRASALKRPFEFREGACPRKLGKELKRRV